MRVALKGSSRTIQYAFVLHSSVADPHHLRKNRVDSILFHHFRIFGLCHVEVLSRRLYHLLAPPFHQFSSVQSVTFKLSRMPRREIKLDDPHDPQKVIKYIEAKARRAVSKRLTTLLNDTSKPIILNPILRVREGGSSFEITSFAQKVASAAHLRGEVALNPCNNCQQGRGPFVDCVELSGYSELTRSCCSNCQFDLNTNNNHSLNGLCDLAAGVCS